MVRPGNARDQVASPSCIECQLENVKEKGARSIIIFALLTASSFKE